MSYDLQYLDFCNDNDVNSSQDYNMLNQSFLFDNDDGGSNFMQQLQASDCLNDNDLSVNFVGPHSNDYLGYCSIDDFNCKVLNSNFIVSQMNCRSLQKNFQKIKVFLGNLQKKPDILILSENWIKNSFINHYQLDGYNLQLLPRKNKRGGGVGAYFSANLNYTTRHDLMAKYNSVNYENMIFEITDNLFGSMIFFSIYRPPSTSITDFNHELLTMLDEISRGNLKSHLLVAGDFNLDLLKTDSINTRQFLNSMASVNLYPKILSPTRVTDGHMSLIDNIFVSSSVLIDHSGVLLDDISDHYPTFITIKIQPVFKDCGSKNIDKNIRMFGKKNFSNFNNLLNNFDWQNLHNQILYEHSFNNMNASDLYNVFYDAFYNVYNKAFPLSSENESNLKANKKDFNDPWMTPQLLRCCRVKSKLLKTCRRFRNNVSKTKYKNYAKILKSAIRKAEQIYYSNMFHKNTSSKNIWKNINSLLRPNCNEQTNSEFLDCGSTITDPKEIAIGFNNFFTNIGRKIADSIPAVAESPSLFLRSKITDSIFFHPTDVYEIKGIISNLKHNSSPGLDCIFPAAIKASSNFIAPILTTLINFSLEECMFPENLKNAKVIPIFKDQNSKLFSNYRPISVLSVFSKIYEYVIKNRLSVFFNKHNVLVDNQFGFREGHSTYMPVTSLVDQITENIDEGLYSVAILLDFKKAFDSLDHNILLSKMEHYGIRGAALKLIHSYLSKRSQVVAYNNALSTQQNIITGVPQGSILGPLLFLIYINDIVNSSNLASFLIYADDTTTIYSDSDPSSLNSKINNDLINICHWCNVNKVAINLSKTKYMIFTPIKTTGSKFKNINISLNIGSIKLEEVDNAKFLGIYIDNKLNWKKHISYVSTKISQVIGVLAKIRYKISVKAAMKIYDALIASHLSYCNVVWGNTYRATLDPVYILQKRALKICLHLPKLTNDKVLFKKSNKLSIFDLNEYQSGIFIYSVLNKLTPSVFDNFLVLVENVHSYCTRSQGGLHAISATKNVRKHSIKIRSFQSWSNIPTIIKQLSSLVLFKKKFKDYLISNY